MTSVPQAGSARTLLALLVGALFSALLLTPAPADAFTSSPVWKCRASAVYASVAGNNRVEPLVANGNPSTANNKSPDRAQCSNEEAGADNLATPLGIPSTVLGAQSASAKTTIDPELGRAIDQKVDATAKVENLGLPLGTGTNLLGVTAATSTTTGSCANGQPQLQGTSQVLGLTLGGQAISLDALPAALQTILAPLSAVADVKFNEQVREGSSLITRAAHIKIFPAAGGSPLVDLVVAETKVDAEQFTCDPDKQIPGFDGKICPDGSTFDVLRGVCVIPATGQSQLIIVGLPFAGPSGGTVLPLPVAIQRYGRLFCLTVKGGGYRAYAVVGTNGRDRITGTNGRDRILGLGGNDSLDGGRGADCIDGGTGADRVTGGVGSDRIYGRDGSDTLTGNLDNDRIIGGTGNDKINGGPGIDYLDGGTGADTIAAGYNADRVIGGPGNDAINIAQQGPAARANCGTGVDKIRLNGKERRRIFNCEIRYELKDK
ncbi:calcium-binding protein [Paraconexibacter algicola]|uniref:Calcium-binding protein n=1 Tax=Paraconexibacter algicola TaxID=2133960 RepID=A0A2T4UM84_9ACTN|nr:calcium-binding protein [Paraconexibacter algicola]PTL60356.1 hypothetical protein C7Y72_12260 [Paraconexibacter algicola]